MGDGPDSNFRVNARAVTGGGERRKAALGTLVGVVISAAIIVFLLKGIDWSAFFVALERLNLLCLPLLVLLLYLSYWIRALRWRYLLPSHLTLSTRKLYNALIVGSFSSLVLPLRAGELIRPWALSRWQPVSFATGFASVVTERVFDVLAMLTFLVLVLMRIPSPPDLVIVGAQALSLITAVIISVMLMSYFRAQTMLALSDRLFAAVFGNRRPALYRALQSMAEEFVLGLRAISSLKELGLVLFWSYALWFEFALFYQVALWGMGEWPSLWVGLAVNVIIALAVAVPSAPGFIGTFQLGCVASLTTIHHYPREFALAYSVLAHGIQVIAIVLTGLVILRKEGLELKELRARAVEQTELMETMPHTSV